MWLSDFFTDALARVESVFEVGSFDLNTDDLAALLIVVTNDDLLINLVIELAVENFLRILDSFLSIKMKMTTTENIGITNPRVTVIMK